MRMVCFDLEGVFIPEIWLRVADHYDLDELRLTTRDVANFDTLMEHRIKVLKKHRIRLQDIQKQIRRMEPLPGAKAFLKKIRSQCPVVILSDTFYEFAGPLMEKLGHPLLLCNDLEVSRTHYLTGHRLRQKDGKRKAVKGFQKMGYHVTAIGDSYNDLSMIQTAEQGIFYRPPEKIVREYPQFPVARSYAGLMQALAKGA